MDAMKHALGLFGIAEYRITQARLQNTIAVLEYIHHLQYTHPALVGGFEGLHVWPPPFTQQYM